MNITEEIEKARKYLEEAEKNNDPQEKFNYFSSGIEILDYFLEDLENIDPTIINYMNNLKLSHARSLLIQLTQYKTLNISLWISYISLFIFNIKTEISQIKNEDGRFGIFYHNFINMEKFKGIKNKEVLLYIYEQRLIKSNQNKDTLILKEKVDAIKQNLFN